MISHLKRYFLTYTIIPLLFLAVGASYLRFLVQYDYMVQYEGECDPYTEICFEFCEDEVCLEPIFYTLVERKASTLVKLCGDMSVLECDASLTCLPDEEKCSITYCDTTIDENCDHLTEKDRQLNNPFEL